LIPEEATDSKTNASMLVADPGRPVWTLVQEAIGRSYAQLAATALWVPAMLPPWASTSPN